MAHKRKLVTKLSDLRLEIGRLELAQCDDSGRAGIPNDMSEFAGRVARVQSDVHQADPHRREPTHEEFNPRRRQHRDTIALLEAEADECPRLGVHLSREISPRQRGPCEPRRRRVRRATGVPVHVVGNAGKLR